MGIKLLIFQLLLCGIKLISSDCSLNEKKHMECINDFNNLDVVAQNFTRQTGDKIYLLNLAYCDIPSLTKTVFKEVPDLDTLYLMNNNLRQIKKGAFSGFTHLQELVLYGTVGTDFEDFFDGLEFLKLFMLEETTHKNFATFYALISNISIRIPSLERLQLNANSIPDLRWLGRLKKLTILDLSKNLIKTLPDNFGQNLPRLHYLNLQYNQISSINNEIFKGMSELYDLNLSDNNIAEISTNAFTDLRSITHLTLKNNSISTITVDTFSNLHHLQTLNLKENILDELPDNVFQFNSVLKNIFLKDNTITSVGADTFKELSLLVNLDLSNNFIEQLLPGTFDPLLSIYQIDLTRNNLEVLETGVFNALSNLGIINITYNLITDIKDGAFKNLEHVHELDLSYNYIETWNPRALENVNKLTRLNLEGNKFKEIDAGALGNLNIQAVNFKGNEISHIAADGFKGLTSLEYLGLSKNNLIEFEEGTFSELINLKCVDILDNNVVASDLMKHLPQVKYVFFGKTTSEEEMEEEKCFEMARLT